MTSTVRTPAVAGRFYPDDPHVLEMAVRSFVTPPQERLSALGCVVPHAGYIYSGEVAGAVFARIEVPQRCIVLCPNHTGIGYPLAIMSKGTWTTPLGNTEIDSELADALKKGFSELHEDSSAHQGEHAIEVQLPFLRVVRPDSRFVPIAIGTRRLDILESLGESIAQAIADQEEHVLIIASSDMNHYESDAVTRVKDQKAIDCMLARDPQSLFEVVNREEISMCGFGPTVSMITAANRLGATVAELVRYATSGDVSGDRDMVVGYAGVVVH
ncbi:MAG TPA: AmmeMemoRadiSam system protein B [Terriglobales bacterium]|jgi:hypothetical protein